MNIIVNIFTETGNLYETNTCSLTDILGCNITGFSINSAGNYYATVTDTNDQLLSITSVFPVFSILQQINLLASNQTPSANFYFWLTVQLQDYCGSFVSGFYVVKLDSNLPISGNLYTNTTTGIASFMIYSLYSGNNTITATVSGISNSILINVVPNLLKIILYSPIVWNM